MKDKNPMYREISDALYRLAAGVEVTMRATADRTAAQIREEAERFEDMAVGKPVPVEPVPVEPVPVEPVPVEPVPVEPVPVEPEPEKPKKRGRPRKKKPTTDPAAAPPALPALPGGDVAPAPEEEQGKEDKVLRDRLSQKLFLLRKVADDRTRDSKAGPQGMSYLRGILEWAGVDDVLEAPMDKVMKALDHVEKTLKTAGVSE